jgi:hypothetical protein
VLFFLFDEDVGNMEKQGNGLSTKTRKGYFYNFLREQGLRDYGFQWKLVSVLLELALLDQA